MQTTAGDIHGVLSGKSHANGTAYNEKLVTAPRSSARVYDSIYVRHWDSWLAPEFNAVFSGVRKQKSTGHGHGESATYSLEGGLQNLVSSIKNAESPYPPFGGSSDYDISPDGKWVAFKSKAPELPEANYTTSYIYLVPHGGSAKPFAINGPESPGTPEGIKGDSSSPVFSPDSKEDCLFPDGRRQLRVRPQSPVCLHHRLGGDHLERRDQLGTGLPTRSSGPLMDRHSSSAARTEVA